MMGVPGRNGGDAMELFAVIGFSALVFAAILALRRAARADRERWSGNPR